MILFSEEHRIVANGPASEILAKRSLLLDVELIDERRVIHVPEIHHATLVSSEAPHDDKDVPVDRPQLTITGPMLDAADPVCLARFYERLLGWAMVECEGPRPGYPPQDGWTKLRSPTGDMKIEFQWEQHYLPPIWPPTEGGQPTMMMHLDIAVDRLEVGVAWAIEAGATIATYQPQEGVSVMLDPEGHPLCLFSTG